MAEAVKLLDKYGDKCRLIAGGTDVLVKKEPQAEVLIGISGLELEYIESNSHGGG